MFDAYCLNNGVYIRTLRIIPITSKYKMLCNMYKRPLIQRSSRGGFASVRSDLAGHSLSTYSKLRKQAYSNILTIAPPKTENFQIKNSGIFHISAQNIDCGYSLEPCGTR